MSIATQSASSYWSVVLENGQELSQAGTKVDLARAEERPIDWSLDVVGTGDILKVKTLSLHCPNGQEVSLPIKEPGTAFQLHQAAAGAMSGLRFEIAHIIGRVDDRETGACTCWAWDATRGKMLHWQDNVRDMRAWKIGHLAYAVQGFVGVAE